jgi:hypothetical protein
MHKADVSQDIESYIQFGLCCSLKVFAAHYYEDELSGSGKRNHIAQYRHERMYAAYAKCVLLPSTSKYVSVKHPTSRA